MRSQRGGALDLPLVEEEMERELMEREEVEPPVAIEVPAPDEPTSDERRHHGLTHLPYQPLCNVCVRARGGENRHVSRSQNQPGTPVIQCDYCFLKTKEDASIVTLLVTKTQCTNGWLSFFSQSGRIRTIRRTSQSDHPRKLGGRTHGSHPRRMRTGDRSNTTNLTREQQGLRWSSRESNIIR